MRAALVSPLVAAGVLSAVVLVIVITSSARGLDLMDESYVIRLIAAPDQSRYAGEVYLFQFLVHPLYESLGRDIAALRVVGAILLVAAAMAASVAVCRVRGWSRRIAWATALVSSAAATSVLTLGVRVPGYRTMALLGLLIIAWGAARVVRQASITGGILIGIGGWITFTGRPTSALAALLLMLACGPGLGFLKVKVMGSAALGVFAGVLATLSLAQMSPSRAVDYLRGGVLIDSLLEGHPSLLAMLGLPPLPPAALLVFGTPLLLVAVLGLWGLDRTRSDSQLARWAVATTVVLLLLGLGIACLGQQTLTSPGAPHLALQIAMVVAVLALVMRWQTRRPFGDEDRGPAALFVLLMLFPYALAVGSNVSIAMMMGQGVVFWLLAGILVGHRETKASGGIEGARLGVFLTTSASVVAVVLWVSFPHPFDGSLETPSLRNVAIQGSALDLPLEDAHLAERLSQLGSKRVTHETPVLDLSGIGPGYALMLGGQFIGRGHLYASWAGGPASARHVLDQVPCEDLARAWVIYAVDDPGVTSALTTRGVDLERDYDVLLMFEVFRYSQSWDLRVLAPTQRVNRALGC